MKDGQEGQEWRQGVSRLVQWSGGEMQAQNHGVGKSGTSKPLHWSN